MATNMAQALDGLNKDKNEPIPPDIILDTTFMPDGRTLRQANPVPRSLQDVLSRMGGMEHFRGAR
jgi:hypothetical protein